MKAKTWLARAAFGLVLLASIGGCNEDDSDVKDAAQKTADTVGDTTRHATEEVDSKAKDAADAVNDTVNDAKN